MRLIPSEGSGRYSPGPGMVELLEERSYQEIRPPVAICSQIPPGILAIDSEFAEVAGVHDREFEGPSAHLVDHAEVPLHLPGAFGLGQVGTARRELKIQVVANR